jgi:phosphoenolpyruvate---glycerone phosphotransferase subunit DhaL
MRTSLTSSDIEGWLRLMAQSFEANMDRLSALDAALGDGDHGTSMVRSFRAIVAKLDAAPAPLDSAARLRTAGMTLISVSGGATGPLFGTIFLEAAKQAQGKSNIDLATVAAMISAASAGVMGRGGAQPGEKTMLDALAPAAEALTRASAEGLDMATALARASAAAQAGAQATAAMPASKGRARYLGERALGHEDAGAHSIALIVEALAQVAAQI